MVALVGERMLVIIIKQLLQALFIFITAFTFGGKSSGFAIDIMVKDFHVLTIVNDVEGGELGIVVGNNVELSLILALAQFFVAFDEDPGEVPDVVVLCKLAQFETGVLEEIFIEDVLVEQGSLDFGLVSEVEVRKLVLGHID